MKLSRIYSSKLYLTSSRKDKIHATMTSPKNAELVQQLSDYLDDDSKEQLDEAIEEKEAEEAPKPAENEEAGAFDSDIPDESNVFSPSYSGGGHHSPAPSAPPSDMEGEPDLFAEPSGDEGGEAPASEPKPEEPVEESTAIYGKVTADTKVCPVIDIASESEVIKGTLNSREDTSGVLRIAIDDNELWIYYKDEVNIGDIMVNVIEVINGAGYTYLTFSRLARSNNAIVFDINLVAEQVKSIKEIEEEK